MAQALSWSNILSFITYPGQFLTADLNENNLKSIHPKYVPWIQSPLAQQHQPQEYEQVSESDESKEAQTEESSTDSNKNPRHSRRNCLFAYNEGEIKFCSEPESNNIQLFYDLFFVTNLTTFSSKHEVTDKDSEFPLFPSDTFQQAALKTFLSHGILPWLLQSALVHLVTSCSL